MSDRAWMIAQAEAAEGRASLSYNVVEYAEHLAEARAWRLRAAEASLEHSDSQESSAAAGEA